MAILPFRDLAQKGCIKDASGYSLDLSAWTRADNVRFYAGKVERAPIWRTVVRTTTFGAFTPQHCYGHRPSTGLESVTIVGDDGSLWRYVGGIISAVGPSGFVGTTDTRSFTSAFLGDVEYVNRPSAVPLYFGPGQPTFTTLPGWNSTWRCRSLRAYGDYMVALNVTKGAQSIGSQVKWSDLALAGLPPASWNAADPTNNAGENVLEGMTSPIVDGWPLRDSFVIYSSDQVWRMQQNGGQSIFTFTKLFNEGGIMSPNCAVEVDGKHFVMGTSDIYVHDGTTKQSIADRRVREYIFANLNQNASEACFVFHNPLLNEIYFCYQSVGDAVFPMGNGCNKAAIYNVSGDTWAFADLPNVASIGMTNMGAARTFATYDTLSATFDNIGGTFFDQDGSYAQRPVAVSQMAGQVTAHRLICLDFMNRGALPYPYREELNGPSVVERIGLALDQVGSDLVTWKNVRRVYPLVNMIGGAPVTLQIGGGQTPTGPINWASPVTFNPTTSYKVDTQAGGRYLAIRFTIDQAADFEIQGFDLDVNPGGRR